MKKRFLAAGAVLAAVAFVGQTASAKTLEDVLKEKGIITEADYKEVTKVKPLDYKLGKGFTFTSADEKFQLSIGGQAQLRYSLIDADRQTAQVATTSALSDISQFELRRIKLNLNGYSFTKDLTYKITFNFANTKLEETYLNYRLIDPVQFRLGQDKVQFGRQWITPSSLNQFVEVTHVTNAFVPGYDAGININGKLANGLAYYSLGGYGGGGQNTLRLARDNAFAARVAVNPLGDMAYSESDVENSPKPLLSIGSSFYHNTLNSTTETTNVLYNAANDPTKSSPTGGWLAIGRPLAASAISTTEAIEVNTAEADAAFKWHGVSLQSEYFMAQADGKSTKRTVRAQGYYVQGGVFVIPTKLELAGRYGYLDPNRDVANDHWVEAAGAVSWYINKHNLKLQADYTNIHKQGRIASTGAGATARPTDDRLIRLQAQLLF